MQDFELWWLLVFPVFFGLGWLAARVDMREVLGQALYTVAPKKLTFDKCCPTLRRREHTNLFDKAIAQAKLQGETMTS